MERVAELEFHEIGRRGYYRLESLLSEDNYDGNKGKNCGPVDVEWEVETWILCKVLPQYIPEPQGERHHGHSNIVGAWDCKSQESQLVTQPMTLTAFQICLYIHEASSGLR